MDKLFVIKKYVMAPSAMEALRREKKIVADDCWIDEDWKKENMSKPGGGDMGFKKKDG